MDQNKTALERAFQLARSGNCASAENIRQALKSEGYFVDQLIGSTLKGQLRDLIREAKK
ncbi:MAG: hypothetical protein ACRD1R_17210 [Acidobacteriota bacterium]